MKTISDEEYAALVEDRERFDWWVVHGAKWFPFSKNGGVLMYAKNPGDIEPESLKADAYREAIDRARGAA